MENKSREKESVMQVNNSNFSNPAEMINFAVYSTE